MWRGNGLRVVELGSGIAAAFGARLLADFGADVIKVEPPTGDSSRRSGPFEGDTPDPERSGIFLYLNHGKRCVTLDLDTSEALDRLSALLSDADAVIENLGPRVFDRLAERLPPLPDRLVVCSISPYGQDGPKAHLHGSELSAYASSGMMVMTGLADRPPVKQGLHQGEHLAGVNAAAATLAASMLARRHGTGQRIDISLQETVALSGFPALNVYTHTGAVVKRAPATLAQLMTSQAMPASDGWIMPSDAGIDVWWDSFVAYLDRPELLEPPFDTSTGRRANHEQLDRITGEAFHQRTKADLFHTGQAFGLTMSSIQTPEEIAACPHLEERSYFVEQNHPIAGRVRMPGPVPQTRGAIDRSVSRPAPLLGQHNDEVFGSPDPPRTHPASEEGDVGLPLDGVRILELGMVFVLPLAITPLAALGADVIKVEAESRPDSVRWGPQPGNELHAEYYNVGGNFHHLNRNKQGVAIDLRNPRGRELLLELVAESDVVAENFTPRVLANLGLSYEELKAVNPNIILLSSSGFGQSGPWQNYKAYGPITESVDGLMHLTGHPRQPPIRGGAGGWGVAFTDVAGAYYGTYSILAALEHRDRTGEGMWLDLSHYEAGVATIPEAMLDFEFNARIRQRVGNRDAERCPQGAYPTNAEDTWVAISVASDQQFAALCRVLAIDSTGFETIEERQAAEDKLDALIAAATSARDLHELETALQSAAVEATAVASPRDVWADPQLQHRGWVQTTEAPHYAPEIGPRPFPRAAWRTSRSAAPPRPAPAFGEHTREVLSALLGMTSETIDGLYREGVVASAPRTGLVNPRVLEIDQALTDGRLSEIDEDYQSRLGL
jgi:crotonobetainyl-CoA:carnitine CoA-transferase CaiB-like acyl-CoA transferase